MADTSNRSGIPVFDPKNQGRIPMEKTLQEAINQDPEIQNASRISVSVEKKGLFHRRKVVHLIGETPQEHDRQRAQEIVARRVDSGTEIVNEIVVG
jgi:osmotically-inducible protein OsmY